MAGKLTNMNVIKQIIRLSQNGESKQGIAATLKILSIPEYSVQSNPGYSVQSNPE